MGRSGTRERREAPRKAPRENAPTARCGANPRKTRGSAATGARPGRAASSIRRAFMTSISSLRTSARIEMLSASG